MNLSQLRNLFLLAAIVLFSQCKTEEPTPESEEELITTMTLTFSPQAGGEDVVFSIFDEDGNGPTAPVYTNGILSANTTYSVSLEVRNDEEDEDITVEIEEEDEEHQFFFQISSALDLNFDYADADGAGYPIGLSTIFVAGNASSGTLTVTLRHEPNKAGAGVINGDITNAGGETDIEATFDVVIE